MRKIISVVLSLALVGVMFAGCGKSSDNAADKQGSDKGSSNAASYSGEIETKITSTDKFTIRVAYDCADTHPSHKAATDIFKSMIETATNGNIKVELYPNSQLGSLTENMESMRIGDLEMAMLTDGTVCANVPEFSLIGMPFLWTSVDAAHAALDGEFGQKLNELLLQKSGIINFAYGETGFRNITNSRNEIKVPNDLKGLKIRTMPNPLHVEFFTSLGAIPTPMAFGELFTALQQKTVDAQENPNVIIWNSALYEPQKYLTVSEHIYTCVPFCIAEKFYNKMPKDYQDLVREAAVKTMAQQRIDVVAQNNSLINDIAAKGLQITELTAEEKAMFQKIAADTVYKTAANQYGSELIELAASYNK